MITIAVVAVVAVVLFIPMMPVEEAYADTEYYDHVEEYTELESFERECKWEQVSSALKEEYELLGRGFYCDYTVTLKNTDNYGGTFSIDFRLYDINGVYGTRTDSEYIGAGQTQTFRAEFDTAMGQDVRGEHTIDVPTVIDERIVTKQRTVIDEQVVTKYKTVYKSIIEIMVSS